MTDEIIQMVESPKAKSTKEIHPIPWGIPVAKGIKRMVQRFQEKQK